MPSRRGTDPRGAPQGGTPHGYRRIFDQLFEKGKQAVLTGTHIQDCPPTDGGRWGMSVVFTTTSTSEEHLDEITQQALAVTGAGQWPTGARGSAHITVRSIELHRSAIPVADTLVARCAAALQRTADHVQGPVRLRLGGLTLTPSGVMTCIYPIDSTADTFAARLRVELGPDAWFEDQYERNIWHLTLIHFAGPLAQPQLLVDWVHARRDLDIGEIQVDAAHVATFGHDGTRPVVLPLASVPLADRLDRHAPPPQPHRWT